MTLVIESPQVYTQLGVAISVTGIAQVIISIAQNWALTVILTGAHTWMIMQCNF